ncbi:MAG TPA: hypothetical protein VH502_09800 [Actinoplanes sp.]|jgi:hypothetical protein
MERVRRLATVAVTVAVAVAGLAGCRSAPSVAAYVGQNQISEDRVSAVYEEARDNAAADQEASSTIKRQDVVDTLVGLDVMREIANQRGLSPTALNANEVAQAIGLKANAEYVRLYGEYRGLLNAFGSSAKPAEPTTADLRDVYNRLTAGGANPNGASFEQFSTGISAQDRQTLAQNIGLRNDLQPQIAKLNTVVNPKYGTPELPLVSTQGAGGQELPLVVLSFAPSRAAPTVVDVP